MKKSIQLTSDFVQLRLNIITEILDLVRLHNKLIIPMAVEFSRDVIYANGVDEQDVPQYIDEVFEDSTVKIYHRGDFVGTDILENLSTEKLLDLLAGVEESYAEAKDFVVKEN